MAGTADVLLYQQEYPGAHTQERLHRRKTHRKTNILKHLAWKWSGSILEGKDK